MKYIIAIIRPEKLEAVQQALNEHEIYLMTVSDVRGCGRQRGFTESFRGNEVVIRLLSKVKLEIAVNEDYVSRTIETISPVTMTGKIVDWMIFILTLD